MRTMLVVGQIPPPVHGQSVMIERLLHGSYPGFVLRHVAMKFSINEGQVGKFRFGKLYELMSVIARIWWGRFAYSARYLYYPPAGPNLVPVVRDIIILLSTRFLFDSIIFHFHGGGLTSIYGRLPRILRALYRVAYMKPEVCVRMSSLSPDDPGELFSRKEFIVPYGIPDEPKKYIARTVDSANIDILFMALHKESKGLVVAIRATHLLRDRGWNVTLHAAGAWESDSFRSEVNGIVASLALESSVRFHGLVQGDSKDRLFRRVHAFCFPTYYESESFPVVLLEALSYSLPIVSSRWRGIPSIVNDGIEGYLSEPRDVVGVADRLMRVFANAEQHKALSTASRRAFEERYSLPMYYQGLAGAFDGLIKDNG